MKYFAPTPVTVSQLNATGWDEDLVVPGGRKITVDHIAETTGAHNIAADNHFLSLGNIYVEATKIVAVNHITEYTGAHGVSIDAELAGIVLGQIMTLGGGS